MKYQYQFQEKDTEGNVGEWSDSWNDIPNSGPATAEYMKTGLPNGAYTFRVRAVNIIGNGPASQVDSTPTSGPQAAPTNLEAAAGDTQVRLTWDDPNDSSIDEYEYRWKVGTDETAFNDDDTWNQILESDASTTRYTVTDLTNGTSYAFQIRAWDQDAVTKGGDPGQVAATPTVVDTNSVPIPPSKPSGFTAAGGHEHVTLTWDDPDDSSIDKYQYQYLQENTDGTFSAWDADWPDIPDSAPGGANETSYTVTGLTDRVNYKFRIRAVDLVGEGTDDDEYSEASDSVEATPLPARPGTPAILSVEPGNREVTLNWRAPPNAVVDKYEVLHLQASELVASNVAEDHKFGYSVAVDGDIAVVGAYRDGDNGADSGAAYVFTRSGGVVWDDGVKLTASDGAPYDNFGISVAVDGDTIVIGASGDDDNGADSGSAYVFTKANGVWSQTAKLTASDGAALDYFGQSVAVDGDTILVGAYQDDDEGNDLEPILIIGENSRSRSGKPG